MGGKSSAPPAPNYAAAAQAQGAASERIAAQQTRANRPNQYTPWGSQVWREFPGDRWQQEIYLSPDLQSALDAQQGVIAERSQTAEDLMGRAQEEVGAPVSWESLQVNPLGTAEDVRGEAEDAIYNRLTSRLDPQWEQERERVESRLWNQGLRPGDEAYDTAVGNLDRARTDAYQQAMNESVIQGGAEAERQFGMDFQRRQQAISEELQRRGWTINEINALLTGQQVGMPSMPGFVGANRGQAPNYLGAAQAQYGANLDAYNADQAQTQGLLSGLSGLATAGAAWAPYIF